ncbi:MAG: SH3 domain-containing protein [Oscillospiraceae bacterium]|nr:SH3 domain-containing protein [Oscillospiraceae bacterium]
MNTIKRLLSLALALTMVLSVLCSCGKIEDVPDGPLTSGDPVVSDVPEVTDAPDTTPEETTTTPATTPEATTTTPATTPEVTTTPATTPEVTTTKDKNDFTVEEMDETTMYATISLNVRSGPSTDFGKIATLNEGDAVTVTGRASTGWYQIIIDENTLGYASNVYLSSEAPKTEEPEDDDVVIGDDDDDDVTVVPDDDDDSSSTTPDSGNVNVSNSGWVEDNGWTYMYNALYKDSYRQVLDEIMTGVKNYQVNIDITPLLSVEESNDFADFFLPIIAVEYTYVRNIYKVMNDSGKLVGVQVRYYVDSESQGDQMVKELRSAANKVIGNLKSSWSDYQKIKYLHDWLVKNSTADGHSYAEKDDNGDATEWAGKWGKTIWPNTAYGSIVDGQPTCLGYAKGMFYLLSKAGYEVTFAEGIGASDLHIWVKVKVDGKWYNIDPTWDDPCGTIQEIDPDYVRHAFLMVTDKYIKETRSEVYDIKFFDDPKCTSTKYDWYINNGCYVTSLDEVESILKAKSKEVAKSNGEIEYVTLKADNSELFEEINSKPWVTKFVNILNDYTTSYKSIKKYYDEDHRVIVYGLYKKKP